MVASIFLFLPFGFFFLLLVWLALLSLAAEAAGVLAAGALVGEEPGFVVLQAVINASEATVSSVQSFNGKQLQLLESFAVSSRTCMATCISLSKNVVSL